MLLDVFLINFDGFMKNTVYNKPYSSLVKSQLWQIVLMQSCMHKVPKDLRFKI